MNIKRCDECNKIIDTKVEPYYSIGSMDYHNPKDTFIRLVTTHSAETVSENQTVNSWVEYMDLDFCVTCFEKLGFKRYCKEE